MTEFSLFSTAVVCHLFSVLFCCSSCRSCRRTWLELWNHFIKASVEAINLRLELRPSDLFLGFLSLSIPYLCNQLSVLADIEPWRISLMARFCLAAVAACDCL